MNDNGFKVILYYCLLVAIFLISLIVFFSMQGCVTAKKAERYMHEHPEVSSKYCADEYPIKDSVSIEEHTDTMYLDGLPVYLRDTIKVNGATVFLDKLCPKEKVLIKYVNKVVYQENTAQIAELESILKEQISKQEMAQKYAEEQKAKYDLLKSKMAGKVRIPIWVIIAACVVMFRKQIYFGVKKILTNGIG